MPPKLERCVKEVKKDLRKEHPDWDDDKIERAAYATCVKSTGQHPSDEENKMGTQNTTEQQIMVESEMKEALKWRSSFSVHDSFESAISTFKRPAVKEIYGLEEAQLDFLGETQFAEINPDNTHFYVVGDAIHPITTSNLHTYLTDELRASAHTLHGVPVMVDHAKKSEDVAGRVMAAAWEERGGIDSTVSYVARIRKTHPVAEAVKVGDISTVSIGARAEKFECSVCGEDMRYCSHHIGKSYEIDGEMQLATVIGRGLTFRELSITPFPADPHASASVVNDSMFTAMETLVESSEYKQTLRKAGVTTMSEDNHDEELLRMAERAKTLEAEKEKLSKEKEQMAEEVKRFREQVKSDLVDQVFELEVAASLTKSEDEAVRKVELKKLSEEVLRSKAEDLKKFSTVIGDKIAAGEPRSKSVVAQEPTEEVPESDPLNYSREQVKAGLRQVFNMRTTESAQRTTRRLALDPQSPHYQEYKELVKRNMGDLLGRKS